jgi:hypothetical protein
MKRLKMLCVNIVVTACAMYGIFYKNTFALNIFIAGTWVFLLMGILIIVAVKKCQHEKSVQDFLEKVSGKLKKRTAVEIIIDRFFDIVLIVALFGSAHWIKGIVWVFNSFIVTAFLENAVNEYDKKVIGRV